jgi:putative ABC transport system permease protein
MSWLTWFALRELRVRRGRSLLSLLALALSVGLLVATGSIGALMEAGVARPIPLLGRPADLWISSAYDVDYDLPADVEAWAEAVQGVADVQPVLRRPVRIQTPPASPESAPRADTLTLLGIETSSYFDFHDLTLAAGTLPSTDTPGLVALAPWAFVRELSLGRPVTVTTPSGDVVLPVVGLVAVENLAAAQQGLVLYAPRDTVANLFGVQDVITALEVRLAPEAAPRRVQAALEKALGQAFAVSAASQPRQSFQLWQRLVLGTLLFVDGLTLIGSVALVHAVFASVARARRRQIALLRAAGAVRRQVLALLAIEATFLGLAGSGLGLVLGLLFARVGAGLVLRGTDVPAAPPIPAGPLLLAVALGVVISLVGSIGPTIQAARQSPVAALRPVHPQPSFLAGRGPLRATLPFSAGSRLPGIQLAIANLARERSRALWIVSALALILAMALGNIGILSVLGDGLGATFGRLAGGDYLVLPGLTTISLRELAGQDTSDVPPLAPGLLVALEDLTPQVRLMGGTTADVKTLQVFSGQPTLLLDIEGYAQMGGFRFQVGDWPSALEAFRQGPAVLLAPIVARRLDAGLGDWVRLDTVHGPVEFRVAGIGDSEFTTCVLDLADGATYLGASEVNAVMVQIQPGADAATVRGTLLDAVQIHGGTLLPLGQAVAQLQAVFHQMRLSISLLICVIALVAGLGVVNAMLTSVAERRREIGLLRVVGATQRQVRQLILTEMALLGGTAALIGTVLGWIVTFVFWGVARAYLGLTGEGASSLTGWLPLLVASGVGLVLWPLLAMLGGLVPAIHAARLPVIQALYET